MLSDVSLSLEAGEVTAVVGPNGAGKSTLLACLAGLRDPTPGRRRWTAIRSRHEAARRARGGSASCPRRRRSPGRSRRGPWSGWAARPSSARAARPTRTTRRSTGPWRPPTSTDFDAPDRRHPVGRRAGAGADRPRPGRRARMAAGRRAPDRPRPRRTSSTPPPCSGVWPDEGGGVIVTLHDLSLALRMADRIVVLADGGVLADGPPADGPDARGAEARLRRRGDPDPGPRRPADRRDPACVGAGRLKSSRPGDALKRGVSCRGRNGPAPESCGKSVSAHVQIGANLSKSCLISDTYNSVVSWCSSWTCAPIQRSTYERKGHLVTGPT